MKTVFINFLRETSFREYFCSFMIGGELLISMDGIEPKGEVEIRLKEEDGVEFDIEEGGRGGGGEGGAIGLDKISITSVMVLTFINSTVGRDKNKNNRGKKQMS